MNAKQVDDDDDDDKHENVNDHSYNSNDNNNKLRSKPFPLWNFVTELPEVFAVEVLNKLDAFSVKCFYDVNTDSRAIIKRVGLKLNNDTIFVREVVSLQQLEMAWEHYQWRERDENGIYDIDDEKNQECFCSQVASTNNLEFLKWAREVKRCNWDSRTIKRAVKLGNLAMVQYCVENGCPFDARTYRSAAKAGHLEILKYLREENGCPYWHFPTIQSASIIKDIDCMKYCIKQQLSLVDFFSPPPLQGLDLDSFYTLGGNILIKESYENIFNEWDMMS